MNFYIKQLLSAKSCLIFVFLCSVLYANGSAAQQLHSRALLRDKPFYSPGGLLDTALDCYGNKYTLNQIAIDNDIRMAAGETPAMMGESQIPGAVRTGGGTHPYAGTKLSTSCTPGYFRLYLETGCGMDDATNPDDVKRLAVMCQVLTDISNFIPSPCTATGQKINIWVQNPGGGGGFLGEAVPFFSMPYSMTSNGIADNMIWITLNSGQDAWTNVGTPLYSSGSYSSFFHGAVAFQFNGTINWHTDLATPPAAGEYDLYTVALHEMLHAMGFHTLINYDGKSVLNPGFQYFTRFDQHLQTSAGVPLITSSSTCSLYDFAFNSSLTAFAALSPGGTLSACPLQYQTGAESNNTICTNAVKYVSSSITVPIYSPACFERGSSLSHFEDECYAPAGFPLTPPASNDQYFVMSNQGDPGPYSSTTNPAAMKRYPQPEERQALCDMGYKVNTSYGSATYLNLKTYTGGACPGLGVAGINDGISTGGAYVYYTSGVTPVDINAGSSGTSILANDFGATGFKCLEVVNGAGTLSATSGTSTTLVTFTPTGGQEGVELLRYIPVNTSGAEGNITYVYVYVGEPGCTPTACDIVPNGSFESAAGLDSFGDIVMNPGIVHCWTGYVGTPDLNTRNPAFPGYAMVIPATYTVPPIDVHFPGTSLSNPNDHFMDMDDCYMHGGTWEGFQGALTSPLINGNTYTISCWARVQHTTFWNYQPAHLMFAVSTSPAPLVAMSGTGTPSMPPGITQLWDLTVNAPAGYYDWLPYSYTFTYTGPDAHRLCVFQAPFRDTGAIGSFCLNTAVDDISIVPVGSGCSFTPPFICSTSINPIDLTNFVSVPGGTFSWPTTPVVGRFPTVSNNPMFDPVTAIAASVADTSNGVIPVSYTYTNKLGCIHTVYANIYVLTATVPPIKGVTTVAAGLVTALTDSAAGGTWSSSNTAVATVGAGSGAVLGVSQGTAVITYLIGSDCRATTIVTVTKGTVKTLQPNSLTSQLSVFPNPNKGTFTISGALQNGGTSGNAKIEVMDMLGKTITRDDALIDKGNISKNITLDDMIPNGIYLIKVKTGLTSEVIRFTLNR
jgi:hypothetical protein